MIADVIKDENLPLHGGENWYCPAGAAREATKIDINYPGESAGALKDLADDGHTRSMEATLLE